MFESLSNAFHSAMSSAHLTKRYQHLTRTLPPTDTTAASDNDGSVILDDGLTLTPTGTVYTLYRSDRDRVHKHSIAEGTYIQISRYPGQPSNPHGDFLMDGVKCKVSIFPSNASTADRKKPYEIHTCDATIHSSIKLEDGMSPAGRGFLENPSQPTLSRIPVQVKFKIIENATYIESDDGLEGKQLDLAIPAGCQTFKDGEKVVGAHSIATAEGERDVHFYKRIG